MPRPLLDGASGVRFVSSCAGECRLRMTARRPDLASSDPERTGARGRIATLGLLMPPGLAATITDLLPADLPGILARDIDGRVDWRIEIVREPLDEGDHEARTI